MVTVVALVVVHESVEDWPLLIDAGEAENAVIAGGGVPSPAMVQSGPEKPACVVDVHDPGGRGSTLVVG